jgi:hypothetical protein
METVFLSETLVPCYHIARRCNPGDHNMGTVVKLMVLRIDCTESILRAWPILKMEAVRSSEM